MPELQTHEKGQIQDLLKKLDLLQAKLNQLNQYYIAPLLQQNIFEHHDLINGMFSLVKNTKQLAALVESDSVIINEIANQIPQDIFKIPELKPEFDTITQDISFVYITAGELRQILEQQANVAHQEEIKEELKSLHQHSNELREHIIKLSRELEGHIKEYEKKQEQDLGEQLQVSEKNELTDLRQLNDLIVKCTHITQDTLHSTNEKKIELLNQLQDLMTQASSYDAQLKQICDQIRSKILLLPNNLEEEQQQAQILHLAKVIQYTHKKLVQLIPKLIYLIDNHKETKQHLHALANTFQGIEHLCLRTVSNILSTRSS